MKDDFDPMNQTTLAILIGTSKKKPNGKKRSFIGDHRSK